MGLAHRHEWQVVDNDKIMIGINHSRVAEVSYRCIVFLKPGDLLLKSYLDVFCVSVTVSVFAFVCFSFSAVSFSTSLKRKNYVYCGLIVSFG